MSKNSKKNFINTKLEGSFYRSLKFFFASKSLKYKIKI